MASAVALSLSAAATSAGVAVGLALRYRAAAPATCGAAIEVPLSVAVIVALPIQSDLTSTPGATRSTQLPKFEKSANPSVLLLAAAVIAAGTSAGVVPHASVPGFPFPAAMA